jgi:hypothetical protein
MKKTKTEPQPELSAASQSLLREMTISEIYPGTVVRDFEMFLQFVASHPLTPSKQDLLPIDSLPALNAQMSAPLLIEMKRPMMKSFPHLSVLFLLARAGVFITTAGDEKTRRFVLNEDILAQWQTFNATERYFTLFEIYMSHASQEMLGERRGFMGLRGLFSEVIWRWQGLKEKGVEVPKDKPADKYLYSPWYPFYAFFDLFGLVTVKQAKAEPGKGWNIRSIIATPEGRALMELAFNCATQSHGLPYGFADNELDEAADLAESTREFNFWQPCVQPYFPEWRNHLTLHAKTEQRTGVFQFKVSLGKTWRRITIDAGATLENLSLAILDAYDFDNDHLHCFEYRTPFGITQQINHPYMDEPPYSDEVTLGELPLPLGGKLKYTFDFGDNWQFEVVLEKIDPPAKKPVKPKLIESHGKAPKQYRDGDW